MSPRRIAGILLPAFSPRRVGDLGIGDTRGVKEWISWSADHGLGFIQILPINENGPEESPYSAISSFALDPIYLSLDAEDCPWLESHHLENARVAFKTPHSDVTVHYPTVRRIKRNLLELAWAKFHTDNDPLAGEFRDFCTAEQSWLNDYCLFRFLMDHHGPERTWDQWPDTCQTPDDARAYVGKLSALDPVSTPYRLQFYAFVQWLCHRQWLSVREFADSHHIKLMGDIPIGVNWHSCDVFFNRDEFHLDWCGGTPPEGAGSSPFTSQWGQNWGIPLYRWDVMKKNQYQWWRSRIQGLTKFFRIFRLDHILGFYRIYAFPWHPSRNSDFIGASHDQVAAMTHGRFPRWFMRPDQTAEDKAANLADGDERLRAIMQAAGDAEVIAEDLGWVPEYVRPHLESLGISGYRIPHWDCNEHGHPTPGKFFPETSFACYSTHDHDPICAIWRGCNQSIQSYNEHPSDHNYWQAHGANHALRVLSEFASIPIPGNGIWPPFTEGVRLKLIKALFDSNARYACLMVTSLFGLDDRINFPGTTGPHNWRFRLPWSVKELKKDPALRQIGDKLLTSINLSRRNPRITKDQH